MSIHRKLTTVCCAAVLALGLAACGSSSDDDPQTGMNGDGMEMPDPTPAEQLAAAQASVASAQTAVDALTGASTPAEIATANSMLAHALAQLATASSIPENQITLLRQQLAGLQMQLNDLQQEIDDERMASDNAQMAVAGATTALGDAAAAQVASEGAYDTAADSLATAQASLAAAAPGSADQTAAIEAYAAALVAVTDARADLVTKTDAVAAATTALEMARTTLAEVDPNHVALQAAQAALAEATTRANAAETKRDELQAQVNMIEQEEQQRQAIADAKPGLDANAMALAMAIDGAALPTGVSDPAVPATDLNRVTVLKTDGSADPAGKLEMSSMTPASIDDWAVNPYERAKKAITDPATPASMDLIVVYDDKEDPTPTAYSKVYSAATAGAINGINTVVDATSVITFTEIEETTNTELSAKIKSAKFDAIQNDGTVTIPVDDPLTATVSEHAVTGTFDGVPGIYACGDGTAECIVGRNENGVLTFAVAGWTFTPTKQDDGDDPYTVPVADADYMHFGFWKNASTNAKDEPAYKVIALFGGSALSAVDSTGGVQGLEGTADYAGPATGNYVRKEFDANGDPEHLYHGQFTASAELTASFGGNTVAPVNVYSITGTVEKFMDGEEAIDSTWSLTLQKAVFGPSGAGVDGANEAPNGFTDTTLGSLTQGVFSGDTLSSDKMAGEWEGRFFGAVNVADTNVDPEVAAVLPSGVAGQFNGHFTNGHVLGAFGAPRKE